MASQSGGMEEGLEACLSPYERSTLVDELRNILKDYPAGQILKELIQNAEDAGASVVKIMHDGRNINQHLDANAPFTKFFQGPALCVYNDAEFTESDWRGIKMLSSSIKEEDEIKIGRFGLGFKSVYHITDYPCIISGEKMLLIDPQQPEDRVIASIEMKDIHRYRGIDISALLNAVDGCFGLTQSAVTSGRFNGTLFWFPLRQCHSALSETIYTEGKVNNLFEGFETEISRILTFLTNLETIELHKRQDGTPDECIAKACIEDANGQLRRKRQDFKENIGLSGAKSAFKREDISCQWIMTISTTLKRSTTQSRWLIVNYFVEKSASPNFQRLIQDKSFGYSPCVGLAICLDDPSISVANEGHLFCFLPLPREGSMLTGLPFHVNGCFALNSSRHHLEWYTKDEGVEHIDNKSIIWNILMITEALPKAYEILFQSTVQLAREEGNAEWCVQLVYSLFPKMKLVYDEKWTRFLRCAFERLNGQPIVYCRHRDKWISLSNATFATFSRPPNYNYNMQTAVKQCLTQVGKCHVEISMEKFDTLKEHFSEVCDLSPQLLSKFLRSNNSYSYLPNETKLHALSYILADQDYAKIQGLQLLPLETGEWTTFNRSGSTVFARDDSQIDLFIGMRHLFLLRCSELGHDVTTHLNAIVEKRAYQIRRLSVSDVKELIGQVIHLNLQSNRTFTSSSVITLDWLKKVWNLIHYLGIDNFKDVPILPNLLSGSWTSDYSVQLIPLSSSHVMLNCNTQFGCLDQSVCNCLRYLGVTILPILPDWIQVNTIRYLIYLPDSIPNLLEELGKGYDVSTRIADFNNKASKVDTDGLLKYASTCNFQTAFRNAKFLLQRLNMFNVIKYKDEPGSCGCLSTYSSFLTVDEEMYFPSNVTISPYCLRIQSSEERFVIYLGGQKLMLSQFLQTTAYRLQRSSFTTETSLFMAYMLENYGKYETNNELVGTLSRIHFLRVGRSIVMPSDVFDPNSPKVKTLFYGESVFPENATESRHSRALTSLGLKDFGDITANDLIKTATALDYWNHSRVVSKSMERKAVAFFQLLCNRPDLLGSLCSNGDTLGTSIKQISCLRCIEVKPGKHIYPECLNWYHHPTSLCKPSEVTSSKWRALIGSSMPTINCNETKVEEEFEWNSQPPISKILEQLQLMKSRYTVTNRPTLLPLLKDIYESIDRKRSTLTPDNLKIIGSIIWTGEGFTEKANVIITTEERDLDLRPHMYMLPADFSEYQELFMDIGCHPSQSVQVLLDTLHIIRTVYDSNTYIAKSHQERDVQLAVAILERVAFEIKSKSPCVDDIDLNTVLMLVHSKKEDKNIILKPVVECIYDNNPTCVHTDEGYYVHQRVMHVAETMGVKSLPHKAILDSAVFGIEDWGQNEPLTTRIRTLLRDSYTDGLSILKEMLQNADDARASVVKFMYDERQNEDLRNNLLKTELTECQGPAIWAYNDAVFSDSDLKNILKFNAETKIDDETKIGKFGLGFNAVYNLTDVPSFVSGTNIVVLDPHQLYLPMPTTGIRVSLPNKTLFTKCRDQFQTYYQVFGCNLLDTNFSTYNGTLFRLPLRTQRQARKSKISNSAYTVKDVVELLEMFLKSAGNMLIFTQHLKKIEFYHLAEHSSDPANAKLLFMVEKENNGTDTMSGLEGYVNTSNTRTLYSQPNMNRIEIVTLHHTIADLTFQLVEHLRGSVSRTETHWAVSWSFGKQSSLKMYKQKNVVGCRPPLAAVAVPCETSTGFTSRPITDLGIGFYNTGHIFCFLPLPLETNLKVHLNAYFAVTSDRRQLRSLTEDDKDSNVCKWNAALLEDALIEAHVQLLLALSNAASNENYLYHSLWPLNCTTHELQYFERSFYKVLCRDDLRLFKGKSNWDCFKNIAFLKPDLRGSRIGDICFDATNTLPCKEGKTFVEIPDRIIKALQYCNPDCLNDAIIGTDEFLIHFFHCIEYPFWRSNTAKRNKVIQYALEEGSEKVRDIMKHIACVPTSPNSKLIKPSDMVHPNSKITVLFSKKDCRFPVKTFCTPKLLKELVDLGMNESSLVEELLLDRCLSISREADLCNECGRNRYEQLIGCIGSRAGISCLDNCSEETRDRVRNTIMVPVMQKPQTWVFNWKADDDQNLKRFKGNQSCKQHKLEGRNCMLLLGRPVDICVKKMKDEVGIIESVAEHDISALVHTKSMYKQVHEFFDMRNETSLGPSFVKQIIQMSKEYTDKKRQFQEVKRLNESLFIQFERILRHCHKEKESIHDSFNLLTNAPIVLIGSVLVKPECVAIKLCEEYRPYLNRLPEQLTDTDFGNICRFIGIKSHFETTTIINVMREKRTTWKCTALDVQEMNALLAALCESYELSDTCFDDMKQSHSDILAPDITNQLMPTNELVLDNDEFETTKNMHVIHPSVKPSHARLLGVREKGRKCFEDMSTGISFGQHEDLVARIQGLLKAYPCDTSIFKELLQNADDAGATEIHFIKDYRTHSSDKIFGSPALQGPALCVYNNSYFTEADIQGIHNLGVGSKRGDPSKTGQYGVGFNAVYHLTDTPSFVSVGPGLGNGGRLCIFDPLCNHVPKATVMEPGQMCELNNVRTQFPDVVLGYPENLLSKGAGTVFRLPLRVHPSNIGAEIQTDAVDDFLLRFSTQSKDCMLFLKNVKTIAISNVTSGEIIQDALVKVEMSEEDEQRRKTFFENVKTHVTSIKEQTTGTRCSIDLMTLMNDEISYELQIGTHEELLQRWLVVQRFGFVHSDIETNQVLTKAFVSGELGFLPLGGIAIPITTEKSIVPADFNRHTQLQGSAFCFLPLPITTGLPVHVNGHFALDHESRRDLWKGDYREEWNLSLIKFLIIPAWMTALYILQKSVETEIKRARAYYYARSVCGFYYSLFPNVDSVDDSYWSICKRFFYEFAIKNITTIFPCVTDKCNDSTNKLCKPNRFNLNWVALSNQNTDICPCVGVLNTLYSDLPDTYTYDKRSTYCNKLDSVFKRIGIKLIESNKEMHDSVEKLKDHAVQQISPQLLRRFLQFCGNAQIKCQHNSSCNVGINNDKIENTAYGNENDLNAALEYLLLDKENYHHLKRLPILLTEDGRVRHFSANAPVYITEFSKLAFGFDDRFLAKSCFQLINIEQIVSSGTMIEFTPPHLLEMLPTVLRDTGLSDKQSVIWDVKQKRPISVTWIQTFYEFLIKFSLEDIDVGIEQPTVIIRNIDAEKFHSHIQLFEDWSFIPVAANNRHSQKLVPISEAENILHLNTYEFEQLRNIWKCHLPTIDISVFDLCLNGCAIKESLGTLIASTSRPGSLLRCLVNHGDLIKNSRLSNKDATSILEFFSGHLELIIAEEGKETTKKYIRSLPLFVTTQGQLTPLIGNGHIMLLEKDIPREGLQEFADNLNMILLKEKPVLRHVYDVIQISHASCLELYNNHILPNIQFLPTKHWHTHLSFLRDKLYNLKELNAIQSETILQLQYVKFIDAAGTMKRANELYCHKNEVFQVMLLPCDILPVLYREDEWYAFLKQIGLCCEVDNELVLRFARAIEYEAYQGLSESINEMSRVLVKCFVERIENHSRGRMFEDQPMWRPNTVLQLRDVRFVQRFEVDHFKSQVVEPYYDDHCLISINNSTEKQQQDLIWSSMNILTDKFQYLDEDTKRRLGIHANPKPELVISHLKNVCAAFRRGLQMSTVDSATIKRFLTPLYEYLCRNEQILQSGDNMCSLKSIPMIHLPDEAVMVSADQVVIAMHEDEQIKPYLYKAPVFYGMFYDFFEKVGCHAKVTFDEYAVVLSKIKCKIGDTEMSVSEFHAVKTTIEAMFKLKVNGCIPSCQKLYLPTKDKRLELSNGLIVIDNNSLWRRVGDHLVIQCFIGFDRLGIDIVDPKPMFKKLPDKIRPRLLTEVVVEEMNKQTNINEEGDLNAKIVEDFLHSDELAFGLCRLRKHQLAAECSKEEYDQHFEEICVKLNNIQVVSVIGLGTILRYNDTIINGTEEDKMSFVQSEAGENKLVQLYIEFNADIIDTFARYFVDIMTVINRCIPEFDKNSILVVMFMLQDIKNPSRIPELMDSMKIDPFESIHVPTLSVYPNPGTHVENRFLPFLDLKIRPFHDHEHKCVAMELEDNCLTDELAEPVYIYVRIIKCFEKEDTEQSGQLSLNYLVETGDPYIKTDSVPIYRLYRFVRRAPTIDTEPIHDCPFDETCLLVRRRLQYASRLQASEMYRIHQRLLLEWHPKNPRNRGSEEYCNRVKEYIENEMRTIARDEVDGPSLLSEIANVVEKRAEQYSRGFDANFTDYYQSDTNGRDIHRQAMHVPQPDIGEARRWFRQAWVDYYTAERMLPSVNRGFNWICYICHQASEKALKAALFAKDAHSFDRTSHSVGYLGRGLAGDIENLASQMENLIGHHTRLRYPDSVSRPDIPSDVFTRENAASALRITSELIHLVENSIS